MIISNFQFPISNKFSNFKLNNRHGRQISNCRSNRGFTLTSGAGQAKSKQKAGFTLIELMIVIAILAGLATMFISSFPASQRRGRDTQRKSDMKQYQTALEVYANKSAGGVYPINTTGNADPNSLCATLGLTNCPQDPKNGTSICTSAACRYRYVSNAAGSSYALWARLESPLAVANPYFIVCSSGITKEGATVPTAANTCP